MNKGAALAAFFYENVSYKNKAAFDEKE